MTAVSTMRLVTDQTAATAMATGAVAARPSNASSRVVELHGHRRTVA